MDQNNGGGRPSPGPGGGRGGSIRRARERAEAGLPPEDPQMPPQMQSSPQRPYRDLPAGPNAIQARARAPQPQAGFVGQVAGITTSRVPSVPQWPLGDATPSNNMTQRVDNRLRPAYQLPASRGLPPQRPPRPSEVPAGFDPANVQQRPDFHENSRNIWGQALQPNVRTSRNDDIRASQNLSPPFSPASRPSTVSSVASIPDFPVPILTPQQGPRRSAPLGPPPSSRRGASSYYSNASYVSPIPEESPRAQVSHGSYASSAAIPSTWGSDSPAFNFYEGDDVGMSDDDVTEEDRESRDSNHDDDGEEKGLVRSASIGRRGKPSMVTTRSSEKLKDSATIRQPSSQYSESIPTIGTAVTTGESGSAGMLRPTANILQPVQRDTLWPAAGAVSSALSSGTGLLDPSTSSSETIPSVARAGPADEPSSKTPGNFDKHIKSILNAHEAASSLHPTQPAETARSFTRLSAIRRPPRLNIDAVREAEARGSLTSLPDLIKRATKLAAMMEIGKRPGSRLDDLSGFPSEEDLARGEKEGYGKNRRGSGLSNMLNAFPPPGLSTPTIQEGSPRPPSTWPTGFGNHSSSNLAQQPINAPKRRKCCGLPLWAFLILFVGFLCIIAAAVAIPIELLVVHRSRTKSAASSSDLAGCQNSLQCQNGGTNTLSSGVCSCICVNGFTGDTCTVAGNSGCTTMNINGTSETLSNVTLGEAIPRLVQQSQTNFSIPLSGNVLLARFNAANLTCESENALVTFDGSAARVGDDSATASTTSAAAITTAIAQRDGGEIVWTEVSYSVATSILHASATTVASAASATSAVAAATGFVVTQEVLDFARVAILYVLQEEEVNNAITAQAQMQHFFSATKDTNAAANVSLGNGNTVNLVDLTVDVGEGNVGHSSTPSMTRRQESGTR